MSRPKAITNIQSERLIEFTWADGHVSAIPWATLRGWCPCAMCQGHGSGLEFHAKAEASLSDAQEVGHYAVAFSWTDDHNEGIYRWDLLRRLCPCSECGGPPTSMKP